MGNLECIGGGGGGSGGGGGDDVEDVGGEGEGGEGEGDEGEGGEGEGVEGEGGEGEGVEGEGGEGEGGEGEGGDGEGGEPIVMLNASSSQWSLSFSGDDSSDAVRRFAAVPHLLARTAARWLARVAVIAALALFRACGRTLYAWAHAVDGGGAGSVGCGVSGGGGEGIIAFVTATPDVAWQGADVSQQLPSSLLSALPSWPALASFCLRSGRVRACLAYIREYYVRDLCICSGFLRLSGLLRTGKLRSTVRINDTSFAS